MKWDNPHSRRHWDNLPLYGRGSTPAVTGKSDSRGVDVETIHTSENNAHGLH